MRVRSGLAAMMLSACPIAACAVAPSGPATLHASLVEAPRVPERGPGGFATGAISFRDRLAWPFTARRLVVAVDGTRVFDGKPGSNDVVGVVELEPGSHVVAVMAEASYPQAVLDDDGCPITFRRATEFSVGEAPVRIDVALHSEGVTRAYADRGRLDVTVNGEEFPAQPPSTPPVATGGDPVVVLAYLRGLVDESRRERDIIAVICHNDKLVQAEKAARALEERRAAESVATTAGDAQHQREIIRVLGQRLDQLAVEAANCVSGYGHGELGGYSVTTSDDPSCTGRGPLLGEEDPSFP
jgi:hypothetical protein